MRLMDVLDRCCVKTVIASPEICMAEATRAMFSDNATVILVANERFQGILTAGDILRFLIVSASATDAWQSPVGSALREKAATISSEESVGLAIETMMAAGTDHLPVAAAQGIVIVSLCQLLQAANALLYSEVQHLQNYIDALHDAPND